ncbi:hypothetical protein K439DRAFT_1367889 [Ramaria rubella]|nr:hypothetical protein K439DRAFT_1367889 [Ramaria rubella]
MELTAHTSGWLDKCHDGLPESDANHIHISGDPFSSTDWKNSLEIICEQRLAAKSEQAIPNTSKPSEPKNVRHKFTPDDVKIVDNEYLQGDYQNGCVTDVEQIQQLVQRFNLRPDQECAFKIVANHAIHPQPDQLKMYLEGMAGTGKSQAWNDTFSTIG